MSKVPEGATIDPAYDAALIESELYPHMTVGRLVEFLKDMPEDAAVWFERAESVVAPIETVFRAGDSVVIA